MAEGSSTSQRFSSTCPTDPKAEHGVGMMGPLAYTQVGKGILKQQQQQPQLLLLQGWRWLHSAAAPHEGGRGDAGASSSSASTLEAGPSDSTTRSSNRQTPAQRALLKRSQKALAQLSATIINGNRKAKEGTAYRQTSGPWDGPGDAPVSAMPNFSRVESREWLLRTRQDAQRMLLAQVASGMCVRACRGEERASTRTMWFPSLLLLAASLLALQACSPGIRILPAPFLAQESRKQRLGGQRILLPSDRMATASTKQLPPQVRPHGPARPPSPPPTPPHLPPETRPVMPPPYRQQHRGGAQPSSSQAKHSDMYSSIHARPLHQPLGLPPSFSEKRASYEAHVALRACESMEQLDAVVRTHLNTGFNEKLAVTALNVFARCHGERGASELSGLARGGRGQAAIWCC